MRAAGGMPASGRELAGLVSRFTSAAGAALALDLRLMPLELLFARGEPAVQMPFNPRRKPFRFEVGSLFAKHHQLDRPGVIVTASAGNGGSGIVTRSRAGGIAGGVGFSGACECTSGKDCIAGGQSEKKRRSKEPQG